MRTTKRGHDEDLHDDQTFGPALDWLRVRRYAVPRAMIERRPAGDRRGACEAAGVGVHFGWVPGLEADLSAFAPDLARWHLPQVPTKARWLPSSPRNA